MSSTHSMNARKCVHAQKPYSSQAFAHESSKVGGRGKREEENPERQKWWGWWKERQPNKTKSTSEEQKQGLPTGTAQVNKAWGGTYAWINIHLNIYIMCSAVSWVNTIFYKLKLSPW